MKLHIFLIMALMVFIASDSFARGGFSGGGRGGFSGGRSFSGGGYSRSYGGSSRSYSGSRSYGGSSYSRTTVINRGGNRYYGGGYYGHPMGMYGGMGMGYGYYGGNGLLTGLIIGSMMHPYGTTMYGGGGYAGGSALLYPNGQVVDQNGYQVGTYLNGQFTPMANGPMVAQQAPMQSQGQPVVIQDNTAEYMVGGVLIAICTLFLIFIIL